MNHELRIKGNLKHKLYAKRYFLYASRGFTLIELLIVIVIIGVLSAILMANFVGVRQRARDAQRKSDLRQIQSALELYRADVGVYPTSSSNRLNTTDCPTSSPLVSGGTIYMTKIPCDSSPNSSTFAPSSGNYYYTFGSSGDTKTYYLYTCLENPNDKDPNMESSRDTSCNGTPARKAYKLTNP